MKRNPVARVALIVMLLSGLSVSLSRESARAFAGGSGTSLDPYRVGSCADINAIDDTTAALALSYIMTADIDCNGVTVTPLANGTTYFSGTFNGDGHVISNVTLSCAAAGCGLFKYLSGATVSNLTLRTFSVSSTSSSVGALSGGSYLGATNSLTDVSVESVAVTGTTETGGVVGYCRFCTALRVHAGGTVTGTTNVGGLFGAIGNTSSATDVRIASSLSSADVSGTSTVGGLVGYISSYSYVSTRGIFSSSSSGTISASVSVAGGIAGKTMSVGGVQFEDVSSTANVTTPNQGAGLVGIAMGADKIIRSFSKSNTITVNGVCNEGALGLVAEASNNSFEISQSFSTSTLVSNCRTAGLVGYLSGTVSDSYYHGRITRSSGSSGTTTSGFAGLAVIGPGSITNSYSAVVNSNTTINGLVAYIAGYSVPTCTGSYWDKQTLGTTTTYCGAGGTGKTTAEMSTQSTYSGWDFSTVWGISGSSNDGYPYLQAIGTPSSDMTVPAVTWTDPVSPTGSLTAVFTLNVSESVTGISAADFTLYGTAGGCTAAPAAATATSSVQVSVTCASAGNVSVGLAANAILDSAYNLGPASGEVSGLVAVSTPVTSSTAPPATTTTLPATTTIPVTTTTIQATTTTIALGQASATTTTSTVASTTTTTVATAAAGSGSISAQVDGDLVSVVSDELQIVGTYGTVASSDGGTFGVARNGSITLKLWTGYIGTASGSVKVVYKAAGKSKSWSCTIKLTKVGKVNKNAKRTSGNWFPKKMLPVYSKCVLPADARVSLKTTKAVITAKVRFVKWWPTTGKPINDITKARIPVGNRALRITIGN